MSHFSITISVLDFEKKRNNRFHFKKNLVNSIDKFLFVLRFFKKEYKVLNNLEYLRKLHLLSKTIKNVHSSCLNEYWSKSIAAEKIYCKFDDNLIIEAMDGLYIKEDFQYDPDLFHPRLLKNYCERIKNKIHLESFVSAMLKRKQYEYLFGYLRFSNLSVQESFICAELRINEGLYRSICDYIHSVFNCESCIMQFLAYYKQSIIPISLFSIFPELYLKTLFEMANNYNSNEVLIDILLYPFIAIANHKDLDSIMAIINIDLVINHLNVTRLIHDIFKPILNKLKNDNIKRIYLEKLINRMHSIERSADSTNILKSIAP